MRILFFAVAVIFSFSSTAQNVRVPSKMEFAGIKLRIMDDAREEIQKDVDMLTASPKYFEIKAERARTYFPIIERVFREENLPDDFKYLCLQESALIADAVSTSNAVGFWQFKDFTAVEVGLRVDKIVDERKNIVASTRGAARYMHNNNQHFDNWLHALQAYQMGAGGAMKVLNGGEGAKSMTINKKTYWYVKKYLAHKIAFEGATDKDGQVKVSEYYDGAGKTLKEIARETNVAEEELVDYNKWLNKSRVPEDKPYAVIIPKAGISTSVPVLATTELVNVTAEPTSQVDYTFAEPGDFPKIEDEIDARAGKIVSINGLPGIVAGRGDRIPDLAIKADISLSKFLKYNDLGIDGQLMPGQVYYMKRKRGKAKIYHHVVQPGETLWSISQKYAIKLKKLKSKNRIKEDIELKPGRVLWLRYIRPSNVAVEYREGDILSPKEKPVEIPKVIEKTPEVDSVSIQPQEIDMDTVNATPNQMNDIQELQAPVEKEKITAELEEEAIDKVEVANVTVNTPEPEKEENETAAVKLIHEVEMGQTYYAISKLYEVSVFDILEWNELQISDKLSIGQKLVIWTASKALETTKAVSNHNDYQVKTHEVAPGETLYKIAKAYNVSVQELMDWNNKQDFSISQGETLEIRVKSEEN